MPATVMDTLGVPQRRIPHGPAPTDERLGFEFKMRKRRFARCLLRADLALEDGCLEEAHAALDEARDLRPDSAELAALERRLHEIETAPPLMVVERKHGESPPAPERAWSWPVFILLAGLLVCGLIAMGFWGGSRAQPVETPLVQAAGPGTEQPVPPEHARIPAIRIEQETIAAPQVAPRIATEEQLAPQPLAPPLAETRPGNSPEAAPVAVTRSTPAPPAQLPPSVSGVVTAELPRTATAAPAAPPPAPPAAVPPVSSSVEQPLPRAAVPESAIAAAAPPPPPATPAVASSSTVDDSDGVRAVLARYEMAYSSLDAAAASAVWPAVNRGALARAFRDLNSQQVSLGACDVRVQGAAARATCSGTASWEPRVGGGLRTEARRWDFELRKAGDAWRIERAIAQ